MQHFLKPCQSYFQSLRTFYYKNDLFTIFSNSDWIDVHASLTNPVRLPLLECLNEFRVGMPSLFWIVAVANAAPFAFLSFNPFDLK
jgi:hypothetical protein